MSSETIVAAVMMVSLTFGAGLQANRNHLIAVLKDYSLLGRALLANFAIVPISECCSFACFISTRM